MSDDDLIKRLRQYEGQSFETTMCFNGVRDEAADRIAALEAQVAAAKAGQVTVKPLVWHEFGKECLRAESPFGLYDVMWGFGVELAYLTHCGKMWKHPTLEAAKAAAQADYEARILAAITLSPAPAADPVQQIGVSRYDLAGRFMEPETYGNWVEYDAICDALNDPIAVHANMLRGTIAKPTIEQIIHLYGVDALCKALAPVIVQEADPINRPMMTDLMVEPELVPDTADPVAEAALHRSFPDAGDGRPMPPMGDELMICGMNEADARFVAVQLANHSLTLRDWRETAINAMDLAHIDYMTGKGRDPAKYTSKFSLAAEALRAIGEASQ